MAEFDDLAPATAPALWPDAADRQGSDRDPRRYTVAYAPNPGSLAWLAGSHWLGRCAASLQPLRQLAIEGVDAQELHRLTAEPRRAGWHAAWMPPFALVPGADWLGLHHALQTLAEGLEPLALPPLHVERVGDRLALVAPASHACHAALRGIAAACEARLRPLADGAPVAVGAEFRFHLPLTGPLEQIDARTQTLVFDAALEYFSDLPLLRLDSLALFAQDAPGADFVLLDHLEMNGAAARAGAGA